MVLEQKWPIIWFEQHAFGRLNCLLFENVWFTDCNCKLIYLADVHDKPGREHGFRRKRKWPHVLFPHQTTWPECTLPLAPWSCQCTAWSLSSGRCSCPCHQKGGSAAIINAPTCRIQIRPRLVRTYLNSKTWWITWPHAQLSPAKPAELCRT